MAETERKASLGLAIFRLAITLSPMVLYGAGVFPFEFAVLVYLVFITDRLHYS